MLGKRRIVLAGRFEPALLSRRWYNATPNHVNCTNLELLIVQLIAIGVINRIIPVLFKLGVYEGPRLISLIV